MRTFKRFFSLLLVLCFMFTFSISAMAANYTAATFEDMVTAFDDASGEDVNIDVTADILFGGGLYGKEGITYTIGSSNDSVLHNASFDGAGTVNVQTDLEGGTGLDVGGDVRVNVSGDIAAEGDGVFAYDNAEVAVTGDITVGTNGVAALDNASVTVNGSIESTGSDGVYAADNAAVSVNGNITGWDDAVEAGDSANVRVVGNLEGAYGTYAYGDAQVSVTGEVNGSTTGVLASEDPRITVTGNVIGGINVMDDARVTVNGDVHGKEGNPDEVDPDDPEGYSDGGCGVWADGSSTVAVTGDVIGGTGYGPNGWGGDGVLALGSAGVTVGGNVVGGGGRTQVGYGVAAYESAAVSVGGDVTGGTGYGPDGWGNDGVSAQQNASVTVGGNVMGGSGALKAGHGVDMDSTAKVSIGGDSIGGDAGSDENGASGDGVTMEFEDPEEGYQQGSLTVGGSVIGGSFGNDLELDNDSDLPLSELVIPSISIGSCGNIGFDDFTDEEERTLLSTLDIKGGLPQYYSAEDNFWQEVAEEIRDAKAGDEITVDAGARTAMPVSVLKLAAEREVTLIIQWDGGEDIVVKDAVDVEGDIIRFEKLAELAK